MKFLGWSFERFTLRTYVLVQPFLAALAAKTALAITTKATRSIEQVGAIDPHGPGLQFGSHVQGKIDVLTPYAGRQAIACIIRKFHGLSRSTEGHRDQHRADDFDLVNGCSQGNVWEERGREEVSLRCTAHCRLP